MAFVTYSRDVGHFVSLHKGESIYVRFLRRYFGRKAHDVFEEVMTFSLGTLLLNRHGHKSVFPLINAMNIVFQMMFRLKDIVIC